MILMNVFLEKAVADNYDEYYDTPVGKKIDQIEKSIIAGLLEPVVGNSMLELGCGTGHWTAFFLDKGYSLTGIDTSDAMLQFALKKNTAASLSLGNAENLPFKNESFDVAASITMLEFVDNPEKVLQEAFRVLKPGAYLILGCLNNNSVLGKTKAEDPVFKNAHFYTPDILKDMLEKYGKVKIETGVYINEQFEITDNTPAAEAHEPVFTGISVQKPSA